MDFVFTISDAHEHFVVSLWARIKRASSERASAEENCWAGEKEFRGAFLLRALYPTAETMAGNMGANREGVIVHYQMRGWNHCKMLRLYRLLAEHFGLNYIIRMKFIWEINKNTLNL